MAITVVTDDIVNVANSTAASTLNNNFTNVKAGLDKALNREDSTDNAMEVDLDMNSQDILNAKDVDVVTLTVGGVDVIDIVGRTGEKGDTGDQGNNGDDGVNAGHTYTFSTTTTDADPGAGIVRFNNASPASTTEIYISDQSADAGNPDIEVEILTWDDSTNTTLRGTLLFREPTTPNNIHIFNITGSSTDNASYTTLSVTYVDGSGSFADADTLSAQFTRTGDKGLNGAGAGDVVGPASATDNVFPIFDGTTGKLLKDGNITEAIVNANTAKVTNATHSGDVTGATTLTITTNVVSLAKMAQVATARFLGRVTAATGNVEALTAAQMATALGYITTTWSALVNGADNTLQRVNLLDYGEVTNSIGSTGGGTQDINLELGNIVVATVDTSTNTFTFSNPTASDEGCSFTLILTNGGSQTVNWPAGVDWPSGVAPTLTSAGVDILEFITVDGGTTWYGFMAGLDMS